MFAHSGGVLEGRQAGGSDTFISLGCLLPVLFLLCGQSKHVNLKQQLLLQLPLLAQEVAPMCPEVEPFV